LGTLSPEIKQHKKQEQRMKVSLKKLPKTSKDSGLSKKVKPPKNDIAPPMPKGKQLKEIVKPKAKKRPVKKITKQKKVKYEPKKIKPKPKQKPINKPKTKPVVKKETPKVVPRPPEKPYIPLKDKKKLAQDQNRTKPKKKDPLAWMHEDKSNEEVEKAEHKYRSGSNISQNIKDLYGEEFGKLTPGQQKYIIDNQEIMRRITQQVLTRVARVNLPRDMNVNRMNVIEFYLHPNGDMSDFRFIKKSGYYVLDDTTKETIEYAYSKYPLPKEKTLIRYNVYYNLRHY
jgi:hypothetical protein